MRILGVDPGLRVTGYGVLKVSSQRGLFPKMDLVEAGVVRTQATDKISQRLQSLYEGLGGAIEELKPDVIAIEKLYAHYKHPQTAILMGHARGVVCLLAGLHRLPLVNIASTHVKKAVSGHGHAGKGQIQRMIQHILGLKTAPEPADVADALAVAVACARQLK
jgi:crossover junction endodeoxyribonuclease RuvC